MTGLISIRGPLRLAPDFRANLRLLKPISFSQMGRISKITIRDLSLLLVGVLLVLAPNLTTDMTGRDSGVFLYFGSRLLEGEVPYRDIWDHKGPVIYAVNALGAWVSPNSELGIWTVELVALVVATFGLYFLLRQALGATAALVACAIFLGSLALVLIPGNFTEEYSLPLAVSALLLLLSYETGRRRWWKPFIMGALFAATVMLRPNNVGITLAIGIVLLGLALNDRDRIRDLGIWILGAVITLLIVLTYFAANSALGDLWDQMIRFNSNYVRTSPDAMIDAVIEGYKILTLTGIMFFATIGWLWFVSRLIRTRSSRQVDPLLSVALLALPLELMLVALSGRSLNHYYIMWLPAAAIIAAWVFARLLQSLDESRFGVENAAIWRVVIVAGSVFLMLLLPARRVLPAAAKLITEGPRNTEWIEDDLKSFGQPYLLMWGAEPSYNFLSELPSPSRYVYQYPLYVCGYVTRKMVEDFSLDIAEKKPLIVDSSQSNLLVPPIDLSSREAWRSEAEGCSLTQPMIELLNFIEINYSQVGTLSRTGWPIYQYVAHN